MTIGHIYGQVFPVYIVDRLSVNTSSVPPGEVTHEGRIRVTTNSALQLRSAPLHFIQHFNPAFYNEAQLWKVNLPAFHNGNSQL